MEGNKSKTFTYESFKNYVSQYVVGEDDIIKLIYVGINAARRSKTIPAFLLRGPPGAGKTMITQIVADYFNAHYVFIQTTLNTTEDELIYKYIPSEQTRSGVRIQYGPLPDALIKSREKITVLTIDEFDKTRPSADALLLDYLQNARVSFRIDDREDVIVGDKNNLIVFITSNDNREFSEPLLRRVITIDFKLPDPKDVEKLLRRHFDDEKIIKTLTTIYIAGLTTELTKPITIQELIQLGYAMTVMPDVDFNQLLLSFVVKNVEDLYKLNVSLERLNVSQIQQKETYLPNVVETIVKTVNNVTSPPQQTTQQQQQETTVQQLLTKIKLPVNKIVQTVNNVDKVNDEIESTFNAAIDTNTFNEYSEVIKTFKPEPTDRPDVLGKFKVVLDDTLRLTSNEPLTLNELDDIYYKMNFEAYVEDYVYLHPKDVIGLIKSEYADLRFTYYTKDVIVTVDKKQDVTRFVLRLDNVKGRLYKAKIYVNKQNLSSDEQRLQINFIERLLRKYQLQNFLVSLLDNVKYSKDEIIRGDYFNSNDYKTLIDFINDTKGMSNLRAKINVAKGYESTATIKQGKGECETKINVSTDAHYNYVEFRFNYLDVTRYVTNKKEEESFIITNDIYKIVNNYVGEYDLIDGIKMLYKMAEELKNYANNMCNELIKNGH
jgi:MoxR-like ATPase